MQHPRSSPPVYLTSSKASVSLDARLGGGGEGEVWSVKERLDVAKLYHAANLNPDLERKILAMIENPPVDKMRVKGHISIAWPTDALYKQGKFAGFMMPRIENSPTIFTMYNPPRRQKECPGFSWEYLMRTALNLAIAVDAVHAKGYVIGDLNESNVLVNHRALVSLIDTDSFQVRDRGGNIFGCRVGKEDFLPPELQGKDLEKVERLPEHDFYGLAVLIFRLLMEGVHPFTGVLTKETELMESTQFYCQKQGAFPYDKKNKIVVPPIMAPRFDTLPSTIQEKMLACFVSGHTNPEKRPSAEEWVSILEESEKKLVTCSVNPGHSYSNHLSNCPWCTREINKQAGKFQTPLPPAKISRSQSAQTPVTRSPAAKPSAAPSTPAKVASQPAPTAQTGVRSNSPSAPAAYRPTSFTLTPRPQPAPSRSFRSFFASSRLSLTWRIWLEHSWLPAVQGLAGGLGLYAVIFAIFKYPVYASIGSGILAALITLATGWRIGLFLNQSRNYYIRISATLTFLIIFGFAIFLFFQIRNLTEVFLNGFTPQMGWVMAESMAAGLIWGIAAGTYRIVARRKSQAAAAALALLLASLPVAMFLVLSQWGIP